MSFPAKFLAILSLAMTACSGPNSDTAIARRASAIAASPEVLSAFLQDTTTKSFTKEHGTQYSYFQADGGYNLVYPGNASVLKGQWEVRKGGLLGSVICYSYTRATFNPATRNLSQPGEWTCQNARSSLIRWSEIRDGDPLNLAKTTVLPRRLPKGINLSIPTAAKEVGLSTNMALNKSPNPDRFADTRIGQ
jgi:hypothetical protein